MEFKISLSKNGLYKMSTYYSLVLLLVVIIQGLISSSSFKETFVVVLFIPVFINIFTAWRKSKQEARLKNY